VIRIARTSALRLGPLANRQHERELTRLVIHPLLLYVKLLEAAKCRWEIPVMYPVVEKRPELVSSVNPPKSRSVKNMWLGKAVTLMQCGVLVSHKYSDKNPKNNYPSSTSKENKL
jgi:hypothetical protein